MRGTENRISQFITQSKYYNNLYQIIGHLVTAIERLEQRVADLETQMSRSDVTYEKEQRVDYKNDYCPVNCSQDYDIVEIYGLKMKICVYCRKEIE